MRPLSRVLSQGRESFSPRWPSLDLQIAEIIDPLACSRRIHYSATRWRPASPALAQTQPSPFTWLRLCCLVFSCGTSSEKPRYFQTMKTVHPSQQVTISNEIVGLIDSFVEVPVVRKLSLLRCCCPCWLAPSGLRH